MEHPKRPPGIREMAFHFKLRKFLKNNGFIYTVRKYRMLEANVWVEDVGLCHRIPFGIITSISDLEPYVRDSGFERDEDWWKRIREFIPSSLDTMYLYRVEVNESTSA